MINRVKKLVLLIFGCVFLVFGIIGIPVPLWPTTPFLILAVTCFARGSDKMRNLMMENKYIGPVIVDWQVYGTICLKAKLIATPSIISSFFASIYFAPIVIVKIILGLLGLWLIYFIWSKPSKRPN